MVIGRNFSLFETNHIKIGIFFVPKGDSFGVDKALSWEDVSQA